MLGFKSNGEPEFLEGNPLCRVNSYSSIRMKDYFDSDYSPNQIKLIVFCNSMLFIPCVPEFKHNAKKLLSLIFISENSLVEPYHSYKIIRYNILILVISFFSMSLYIQFISKLFY